MATINEFRKGDINILIATAVVEEGMKYLQYRCTQWFSIGLDIPTCDLVIRFNKPNNFSSYMQSKGRARAKQHASYVLFMDKSDAEGHQRDQNEYNNYEEIEKVNNRLPVSSTIANLWLFRVSKKDFHWTVTMTPNTIHQ